VAGRTVDQRLDAADVRLKRTVGAAVRVTDFNTETYAFVADGTLSHGDTSPLKSADAAIFYAA